MTEPGPSTPELDVLRARLAALEREYRNAFDQAQREADALFAQYQLSQLVASGGSPAELGQAVVVELVRLAGSDAGAIWLGETGRPKLGLVAATGEFTSPLPGELASVAEARDLATRRPDLRLIVLGEDLPASVVGLAVPAGGSLDDDGLRVAQLARHELASAFASARLREALDRERHELGAVVDGATDVIIQVDEARRVVRLNPAGERTLGIEAALAIGRSCGNVLGCAVAGGHGEDHCPLAEVIATARPIGYRETAIRGAQGMPIRVAGGYSRTPSAGGPIRATAILRDLSAVRALEQLREGFVATVSHELRTPLALVRGYAETILHFELPAEEQREYVERIHGVTSRLGSLVDQILDITHLDADPLILERAPVAFSALVARLRGDLEISGEDARLVTDLAADLPPIEVDIVRIGRVLENLVGNALKYAPAPTPIVVGAKVDGDWLIASIDDEGVGVPEAERSLVLEPFHRAWNVRESRIPGTGLGLYICRRLVEAHGGRLSLGDRPDGRPGTRVGFSLPLLGNRRHTAGERGRRAQAASQGVARD
jgi:signal transduction histidine kinase